MHKHNYCVKKCINLDVKQLVMLMQTILCVNWTFKLKKKETKLLVSDLELKISPKSYNQGSNLSLIVPYSVT